MRNSNVLPNSRRQARTLYTLCTLCREENVPMTTPFSQDHEPSLGSSTHATGSPLHRLLRALHMYIALHVQGIASLSVDTALPPGHVRSTPHFSPHVHLRTHGKALLTGSVCCTLETDPRACPGQHDASLWQPIDVSVLFC